MYVPFESYVLYGGWTFNKAYGREQMPSPVFMASVNNEFEAAIKEHKKKHEG
jgi:hypothetical protein